MPLLYTPENMHAADEPLRIQAVVALGAVRDAEGRVLAARRIDPSIPDAVGKWEFVGGKVEFGEDPAEAVVREVAEESGLAVAVLRLLPQVFTNVWAAGDGSQTHVLLLTYECRLLGGQLTTHTVQDEIDELRFVTMDELKTMPTLPNVQQALQYL